MHTVTQSDPGYCARLVIDVFVNDFNCPHGWLEAGGGRRRLTQQAFDES